MADISPELAAKIQDLEVRYDDNPGRVFVALASAYREAGEIGRAEELLRTGLKRHPGSLSAHVLLGRCLADRGAVGEANNEFRYVLSVDPQNLIALRTLGEMAAAVGQPDEAGRWYRELLSVDPMNKEARDALDALASAPAARAAAPAAEAEPAMPDFGMVEIDTSHDASPSGASQAPAEFGMVDFDLSPQGAPEAPAREEETAGFGMVEPGGFGLEIQPEPAVEPAEAGFAGFGAGGGFGALDLPDASPPAEFGMVELAASSHSPQEPAAGGEPALSGEFGGWGEVPLETEEPAAPAPAGDPAGRSAGDYDTFSFGGVELGDGAAPAGFAERGEGDEGGLELPEIAFGGDAEPAPHDDDGELVTETMADLYARQGFHDRAADVLRELIRRRGEEPALVARLAEVEAMAGRGGDAPAVAEPWGTAPGDLGAEEPELLDFGGAPAGGNPFGEADPADEAEGEDLPLLETGLPGLGLPTDPGRPVYEPEPAAAGTGDVFADSFANGFAGAAAAGVFASAPAAPAIEATGAPSASESPSFDTPSFDTGFESGTSESALAPEALTPIADQPYGLDSLGASHADEPVLLETPELAPTGGVAFVGVPAHDIEPPDHAESFAEREEEAPAAPAPAAAGTMAGYLASLLAWRPGGAVPAFASEAAPAPAAGELPGAPPAEVAEAVASLEAADELSVEADGAVPGFSMESDEGTSFGAGHEDAARPRVEVTMEEVSVAEWERPAVPASEADPWSAPAEAGEPAQPEEDLPWIDTIAPAAGPETPAAVEPAPWEAAPWESAAPSAPAGEPAPLDAFQIEDTPLGEAPREIEAPRAPAEELLPWEFASEPPAAAAPAEPEAPSAPAGGGFSFEDFFSAPAPAPEPPAAAPLPVPLPEIPAAPAARDAAPAAGGGEDEEEDLESFQAWLQSLKR